MEQGAAAGTVSANAFDAVRTVVDVATTNATETRVSSGAL